MQQSIPQTDDEGELKHRDQGVHTQVTRACSGQFTGALRLACLCDRQTILRLSRLRAVQVADEPVRLLQRQLRKVPSRKVAGPDGA